MPNASARSAIATPMPPSPTSPSVRVFNHPNGAKFQCSGGSSSHVSGRCFSKASMPASTNSAIGIADAPRAHVTVRPSNSSRGKLSTPVPGRCTQSTRRAYSSVWGPHPPNNTSAAQVG